MLLRRRIGYGIRVQFVVQAIERRNALRPSIRRRLHMRDRLLGQLLHPIAEFLVETGRTRMGHADSVDNPLVRRLDFIVCGIHGARRTSGIRKTYGDTHRTRDARSEIRAIEIRRPLLGGSAAVWRGGVVLDDFRPSALPSFEIPHRIGDRRHVERRPGERTVQSAKVESETAALRRTLVPETGTVDVRARRKPIDGAIDAEQDRMEEICLARLGDSRMAVVVLAVFRLEFGIHLFVFRLKSNFLPLPVRRECIHAELYADRILAAAHVVRPATESGGVDAEIHGERSLRMIGRNAHVTIDAAAERGERYAIVIEILRAALRDPDNLRIEGNFTGQSRPLRRPIRIEIGGRRAALDDFLRLEADAENKRIIPAVLRRGKRQTQEAGLLESGGNSKRNASRVNAKRQVSHYRRTEIVQLRTSSHVGGEIAGGKKPHDERRLLAAAVYPGRPVDIDFVCSAGCSQAQESNYGRDPLILQTAMQKPKNFFTCFHVNPFWLNCVIL